MSRERYTHGHHESVLRSHSWRTVENSVAYVADQFQPGTSVLDVGCGPGTITVDIAKRVAPARVVGMDASAEVIGMARSLAAERGLTNVEFETGDAYALAHPDASFDVVHAHQILHHLGDPVAALAEMRRVRRDSGLVAVREVDFAGVFWFPHIEPLAEWLDLYRRVHRGNGGEPDAGRHLKAWAMAAGFTDITVSASMWSFASEEEREWWGSSWADRVLNSQFAHDAIEGGYCDRATLERIHAAWLEWAAADDGWFGLPSVEVLARG